MTAEEWRRVASNPDYAVSSAGRVISYKRPEPRLLKPGTSAKTYPAVNLCADGVGRTTPIHHLVADAFLGPRPEGLDIRHLDGNPHNNHVSNLRYGTTSENILDAVQHGTHHQVRKTHCPKKHPYDEANTRVSNGRRFCKTCSREESRARYERRMAAANVPTERAA